MAFADVDRDNRLSLRGVFKLLQEAAIAHANRFDTGTEAMVTRGQSWVLSRIGVEISRYPVFGETLRVETWSSGIRAFRGYRDFRIRDAQDRLIVAGSSLWLFFNVRTQAIIRVPRELAERFPCVPDGVFYPDIESRMVAAVPAASARSMVSVRYSDVDANHHVNNTAYLDYLQAALARQGRAPRPGRVFIKYGKGIPEATDSVEVALAPSGWDTGFSIEANGAVCAQGSCGDPP